MPGLKRADQMAPVSMGGIGGYQNNDQNNSNRIRGGLDVDEIEEMAKNFQEVGKVKKSNGGFSNFDRDEQATFGEDRSGNAPSKTHGIRRQNQIGGDAVAQDQQHKKKEPLDYFSAMEQKQKRMEQGAHPEKQEKLKFMDLGQSQIPTQNLGRKKMKFDDLDDRLDGLDFDDSEDDFARKNNRMNTKNNKELNDFIMKGKRAPRHGETFSEIADPVEKDKLFNHSIKSGVFKNINESPLKKRMNPSIQMYLPQSKNLFRSVKDNQGEPDPFSRTDNFTLKETLQKLNPPINKPVENALHQPLDIGTDFIFNPKKFFCTNHPSTEIEYVNQISGNFYCKQCRSKYKNQDDKVLSSICKEIQEKLTQLKQNYHQKKTTLMTKLQKNQTSVEELFKFYYSTLDQMRIEFLKEEYTLQNQMMQFEDNLKSLVDNLKKYSLIEFFHEEDELKQTIQNMQNGLSTFSTYLPKCRLSCKDLQQAKTQIKVDLRERINQYVDKIDHTFALENYKYVLQNIQDDVVKDVYKKLGPFDHFEYRELDEIEMDQQRSLRLDFDHRKSGAMYRGQISEQTTKPDGFGFKVYPNNSIFEGQFADGQINGWGRGVTPRGEVYQGPFIFDQMCGDGLFQWPDGRLYYGAFQAGKKNGKGIYMWPNGQTYDGEFRNDECSGFGILHYPDGKRFEGPWKEGKKHGKGIYAWPNGAKYHVNYIDGVKKDAGRLEGTNVSLDQLKITYENIGKRAYNAKLALMSQDNSKQDFNDLNDRDGFKGKQGGKQKFMDLMDDRGEEKPKGKGLVRQNQMMQR